MGMFLVDSIGFQWDFYGNGDFMEWDMMGKYINYIYM
jgi:hypothetical protein